MNASITLALNTASIHQAAMFVGAKMGTDCTQINEVAQVICVNIVFSSYACLLRISISILDRSYMCNDSYINFLTCNSLSTDVNECERKTNRCSQLCNNTEGSYNCHCMKGYQLKSDNVTCESKYFSEMEKRQCRTYSLSLFLSFPPPLFPSSSLSLLLSFPLLLFPSSSLSLFLSFPLLLFPSSFLSLFLSFPLTFFPSSSLSLFLSFPLPLFPSSSLSLFSYFQSSKACTSTTDIF